MLREKVEDITLEAAASLHADMDVHTGLFLVDKPRNPEHGDFSVDAAFKLAKQLKKKPFDIATILAAEIRAINEQQEKSFFKDITVAQPGFINFTLGESAWRDVLRTIRKEKDAYGASNAGADERVILEYVSANPTGPLTIAHGRQACIGDALARCMNKAGFKVYREYYLNDGGRQIRLLGESTRARYLALLGIECPLPEDGYQGDYIRDLAQQIVDEHGELYNDPNDEHTREFFSKYAVTHLMNDIKKDLQDIGVAFDGYTSERSMIGKNIEDVLKKFEKKGYLEEKDGALWFLSTKFGDDKDRVLRKSDGSFTYLVPDIAYHAFKFQRDFMRVIDILGPDHHGYVKRLHAAVDALGYDHNQLEVLIVQLTTLFKNGEPYRMSTRAGTFVSLRELIDEVGADATRFFFLMRKINSHLDFDLELAKEKSQNNPVYYLQYAHARIASLLKYAERTVSDSADLSLLVEKEELELIKILNDFPYQVAQTALTREPYRVVDYLNTVAAQFHRFYTFHRVVTDDELLTSARLFLCEASRIVIRNGLELLGVSHPDEM